MVSHGPSPRGKIPFLIFSNLISGCLDFQSLTPYRDLFKAWSFEDNDEEYDDEDKGVPSALQR